MIKPSAKFRKSDSATAASKHEIHNKTKFFYDKWRSLVVDGGARVNAFCGKECKLVQRDDPSTKSIYDIFLHGHKRLGEAPCFGWRNGDHFESASYETVKSDIAKVAKVLRLGTNLQRQGFVGIYSSNSSQWMTAALACASSSFVLVPLYDTLGAESSCHIVNETEMSVLLVDTAAACRRILDTLNSSDKNVTEKSPLRKVIIIGTIGKFTADPIPDDLFKQAAATGIDIANIQELIDRMANEPDSDADNFIAHPEDLYMVQYTSGTTGVPKGVILTHGQMVANVASVQSMYHCMGSKGYDFGSSGYYEGELSCLHYLPLAHSYGQLVVLAFLYNGGMTAFFSGNVINLINDLQLLRPTYMPLVPRLMNKVYSKVIAEMNTKGPISKKLFWLAYEQKRKLVRQGIITRTSIWDKLVFQKIQAKLGGRCKFMLTASAPLGSDVLEFWRVVFGTQIIEVYGQTECCALVTAAIHPDGGNVGHPVACNMIKLADVPEMDISASSGRGEVCVKGFNVMKGYYKRPDLTAEAIDADGWLHTGDIGEFTADGSLKLVDRKKHIFKLQQGEYIAPEKIESIYGCCPLVAQVYVDGCGMQWFTVAIVVPDVIEASKWAAHEGITGHDAELEQLCVNKKYIRHFLNTLLDLGRSKGLNQLEQIRSIHLHPELFSIENNLLTPSLKNRRPQLRSYFKQEIDKMYSEGPMIESNNDSKN